MAPFHTLTALSLGLSLLACSDTPVVTGGFRETLIDAKIRGGQSFEAVDIDADGDLDIVSASSISDTVQIHFHIDGKGNQWVPIQVSGTGKIVAGDIAVGDIDGDQDLDIAALALFDRSRGEASPGGLVWYENTGDPARDWNTHVVDMSQWGAQAIGLADLSGNGFMDIVLARTEVADDQGNPQGNGLYWFRNEASGQFSAALPIDADLERLNRLLVSDVDDDGVSDVIVSAASIVLWYENRRPANLRNDNPFFARRVIQEVEGTPAGLALANLDQDPGLELVVGLTQTSSSSIRMYKPQARPSLPWEEKTIVGAFGEGQGDNPMVAAADFDQDGRIDVVATTQSGGTISVYVQNAENMWTPQDVRRGYRGISVVVAGHIDDDMRPDIITSTVNFGLRDRLAWWRNQWVK